VKLLNIGFGNMISEGRIIAVISPESAPVKRMISQARESGRLIDATCGRRTKSVIVMDSDHIVLSALPHDSVAGRLDENEVAEND